MLLAVSKSSPNFTTFWENATMLIQKMNDNVTNTLFIMANFTRVLRRQPIEEFNNVIGYRKWATFHTLL